ncbi:MAG: sulfotransferase, partial [Phycisphaeraceae bacterium]|nr:sulfotransferase [Phycisphaeraceae bacterium]
MTRTDTKLPDPLFLVGTGRCGSSLLHRLLAAHPRAAYLTGFAQRWPGRPGRQQMAMRLASTSGIGSRIQPRLVPGECYGWWDHHFPGFSRPGRDLRAGDISERCQQALRRAAGRIGGGQRDLPVFKITGWPRIGLLKKVWPEARLVHVVRDGRATASSFLHVNFWEGWRGPSQWRWGSLTDDQQRRWDVADHDFVTLAGIMLERYAEAWQAAEPEVAEDQLMTVKYT